MSNLSPTAYSDVAEFARLEKPSTRKGYMKIWHGAVLLRLDGAYDCVFRSFYRGRKEEGIQAGGFTEYGNALACLLGRINELCNDGYEHCTPNSTGMWDDLLPDDLPPTPEPTRATLTNILSHRDGGAAGIWFW